MLIASRSAAPLTVIGHRIECGARAAGVALLGRSKLGPVPPMAWVAGGGNMPDVALPLHEIEECEEHVPRHNPGIKDEDGYTGEEAHFTCLVNMSGFR